MSGKVRKEITQQQLYALLDECITWMQEVVSDDAEFISVLRGCGFEDEQLEILGIDYESMEEDTEDCIEDYLK